MKRKRKLLAILTSAICLATAFSPATAFADGQKVLTLGADLDAQQRTAILNYFGVNGQNIQTLTITNQDERNHLGSYVPLEQIGTRTYSCALVCPTNSGGIQVKTANLSWVTSNMIATTLSTSGVVNCDVLAAAPFEVSGTGALTGILMAYETAVGVSLDTAKKEVATQELITTTNIANNIGQVQATEIVNESKKQVIQGQVVNGDDIDIIINEVAAEENISLSEEDREMLSDLLTQIAQQDYDYEQMKETLDRVEANMNELLEKQETQQTDAETDETETPSTVASDSILNQTDDGALGDNVTIDATDPTTVPETPQTETQPATEAQQETVPTIDIVTEDSYSDTPANTTDVPSTESIDITVSDDNSGTTADSEAAADNGTTTGENTGEEGIFGEDPAVNTTEEVPTTEDTGMTDEEQVVVTVEPIAAADMVFEPWTGESNNYAPYDAGQNELTVFIPRADVVAGTGSLTVNNADGSAWETVSLSDSQKAAIAPMTDAELADKGWTEGTKAVVYLNSPLAQQSNYYVTLTEDAFMTADDTVHSEALAEPYYWTIQTTEYGFAVDKTTAGITAGSTVSGQIMMDGTPSTYARIENMDTSQVAFDAGEFTQSGSFNATFYTTGDVSFQIAFYDVAEGNLLKTIDYTVTVK